LSFCKSYIITTILKCYFSVHFTSYCTLLPQKSDQISLSFFVVKSEEQPCYRHRSIVATQKTLTVTSSASTCHIFPCCQYQVWSKVKLPSTILLLMFRAVFWVVLPCKMIVDRRFRGTCCLHHQGWISRANQTKPKKLTKGGVLRWRTTSSLARLNHSCVRNA
jgi:hypothetical protein